MEFLMYPTTVKMLAAELISVCDAYISRKIGSEELKNVIHHYASNCPESINAEALNPTVLTNRENEKKLVNKMLEGY